MPLLVKLLAHDRAEPLQEGAPLDAALRAWENTTSTTGAHADRLPRIRVCVWRLFAMQTVPGWQAVSACPATGPVADCFAPRSVKLVNHPHIVLSPSVVINVLSERAVHDVCGGVTTTVVRSVWHWGVAASSAAPIDVAARASSGSPCRSRGHVGSARLGVGIRFHCVRVGAMGQPHQPGCDAQEPASANSGVQQGPPCTQEEITSQAGQLPLHSVDADGQGIESAIQPRPAGCILRDRF